MTAVQIELSGPGLAWAATTTTVQPANASAQQGPVGTAGGSVTVPIALVLVLFAMWLYSRGTRGVLFAIVAVITGVSVASTPWGQMGLDMATKAIHGGSEAGTGVVNGGGPGTPKA